MLIKLEPIFADQAKKLEKPDMKLGKKIDHRCHNKISTVDWNLELHEFHRAKLNQGVNSTRFENFIVWYLLYHGFET